jgi:sulfonate transport system permease protein
MPDARAPYGSSQSADAMLPNRAREMRRAAVKALHGLAIGSAAFAAVALLWLVVSRLGLIEPFLLPAPSVVLATARELLADGTLWVHTMVSCKRVVMGFGLAVAVAVPLALVFAFTRGVRRILEPPLEFLRHLPPLALIPLFILWLGIGEAQKVGVIMLACFFPVFLGVLGGVDQADPKLVEVGRVCGFSRAEIVRRIVLPAAFPSLVIGLRIGLGYSWRALVGAELVASSAGLGYLIVDAENLARTDVVLVGVLVIGVLGLAVDHLARVAVRRAAPWHRREIDLGYA